MEKGALEQVHMMQTNLIKAISLRELNILTFAVLIALGHFEIHAGEKNMEPKLEGVSFRYVETNGIRMRIAESGVSGPLGVLAHGWPESWYSWRHQLTGLAQAGYRVVAPDMRGYGETDAPEDISEYDLVTLSADMLGVLEALGEKTATIVGHDWGAPVAQSSAYRYPDRFTALVMMSVPYSARSKTNPIDSMRAAFGDNFFYILYHNEEGGVAEAEYDSDPRGILSRLYLSPQSPRANAIVTDSKRAAGGWIPRLGAPLGLPDWLTQEDLDYVVGQFEMSGFRGGVNYYRNIGRNWELSAGRTDERIKVPSLFIAGELDVVIGGVKRDALESSMKPLIPDLRDVILIPEKGHWVQQEAPEATNEALIHFLSGL